MMIPSNEIKEYLSKNAPNLKVIFADNIAIEKYRNLERGEPATPILAFIPQNENEVEQVIKLLNFFKIPSVIFAGNTGLVSAQRSVNQAIIDLNELSNLISIQLENGEIFKFSRLKNSNHLKKSEIWETEFREWLQIKNYTKNNFKNVIVETEAGVPIGTINQVLSSAQIEVPIDTGAVGNAWGMSAGAAVANASHGTYGLLYGKASDLCLEAKAINGNGSWRLDRGFGGKNILINDDEVVINSAKPQYGDSSIGTQGTFALITNLKFVTKPIPQQRHYFLIKLENLKDINNIRKSLQKIFPKRLLQFEIMNQFSLEIVKNFEAENYINPFYFSDATPQTNEKLIDANYVLMLQIIGFEGEEDFGVLVYEHLIQILKIGEINIAYAGTNGGDFEKFIKLRHSISGASSKSLNANKLSRITPDVSVPPKNIEKYIDEVIGFSKQQNLKIAIFGHIGIGSFHLHIFYNQQNYSKDFLIENIYQITNEHFGSCWSEHGIGTANAKFYKKYTAEKYISEWLNYKQKYDPKNILSSYSNGFF